MRSFQIIETILCDPDFHVTSFEMGGQLHTRVLADTLVLTSWFPEMFTHLTHLHRISEHIFTFRTNSNYLSNSR